VLTATDVPDAGDGVPLDLGSLCATTTGIQRDHVREGDLRADD
jgi:hypothetical protein